MKTPIVTDKKTNHLSLGIFIEQDEDGIYIVSYPQLKSCHSYGSRIEQAEDNIEEVIALCMEEEK
jgi:predicted RNase H-like HicB family nuclease